MDRPARSVANSGLSHLYSIDRITSTSPFGMPTTRTLIGWPPCMSRCQFLLALITSTTFVLLGSSNRTYCPSGDTRPKFVVVVVTGHSIFSVVSVRVVLLFSSEVVCL